MNPQKLVKMANEIAAFFEAEPDRKVVLEGIANHLKRFWDPRMRRELLAHFQRGGEGLRDSVREALETHSQKLTPAADGPR
ncbi:MAG: formate dehydrogenase subunit delta [Planctomycetes bacterium]|nr:formate dehydrogenase subunit delta [Planctomycetota bacterium]